MANFLPIPPTNAVSDPQARAALDALSQNIQIAINTFATKASVTASSTAVSAPVGNTYGNIVGSSVNNTPLAPAYTRSRLTQDLETGAASIISNGNTSDNIMKTGLNYILFQNKNAIPLGSTGAYTGTVRTALGLLSTGIVGGYNDPSTGNWVSSITIDTSTGNLNVLGTIKANSIISASAYLDSTLVSTVVSNASSALAGLTNKLNKSASDILSGTISLSGSGGFATGTISVNGSGVASGSGVAITSKGIVGLSSSSPTFSIDATTGAATFKGDITGSNGIFNGSVSSSVYGNLVTLNEASNNYFRVYDSGGSPIFSISGVSGAFANVRLNGADSYLGALAITNSAGGPAIYGVNNSTGHGVFGNATTSSSYGVLAANVYGGNALYSNGKFGISSNAFVNNLYANYSYIMVGAAYSTTLYFYQGPTTGASTAGFIGSNKPGLTSGNNQWLEFIINGVSYQIPVWAS